MNKFKTKLLPILIVLTVTSLFTFIILKQAKGYKFKIDKAGSIAIEEKGFLAMRSVPESAKIYIDGILIKNKLTNTTITDLEEGIYKIKVEKNGYYTWEKDIQIEKNKVTDTTALLALKENTITPLTSNGVKDFIVSNSGEFLYFTEEEEKEKGLYVIKLSNNPLSIFKNNKDLLLEDDLNKSLTSNIEINISPKDEEILLKINEKGYFVINLEDSSLETITETKDTSEKWDTERAEINKLYLDKYKKEEIIKDKINYLETKDLKWSYDEKKFLYREGEEIIIYNLEKPLPIGEKKINKIKLNKNNQINWYSDSKHLIIVEEDKINLTELDGQNTTTVYEGEVLNNKAYPNPDGSKIIFLTRTKDEGKTNIYSVNIR